MDWANERYVRVYVRDTDDLLVMSWQARALLWEMTRKADRSGLVETKRGPRGLAVVTHMPLEVVEAALPELMEGEGAPVVQNDRGYLLRNFIEAQETPQSDKQRARESRGRRRDLAAKNSVPPVAKRDDVVTNRDATVTAGHTESQEVTPRHSVPSVPSDPCCEVSAVAPPPAQPILFPEEQAARVETARAPKKPKPTEIPAEWQPTARHRALATERSVNCDDAAARFRNHHAGKLFDGGWAQINGQFENWLRREGPGTRASQPFAQSPGAQDWHRARSKAL